MNTENTEKNKSRFTEGEIMSTKQKLLTQLQHQDLQGKETNQYYLQGIHICLSVFCSWINISRHIALKVLSDFSNGYPIILMDILESKNQVLRQTNLLPG